MSSTNTARGTFIEGFYKPFETLYSIFQSNPKEELIRKVVMAALTCVVQGIVIVAALNVGTSIFAGMGIVDLTFQYGTLSFISLFEDYNLFIRAFFYFNIIISHTLLFPPIEADCYREMVSYGIKKENYSNFTFALATISFFAFFHLSPFATTPINLALFTIYAILGTACYLLKEETGDILAPSAMYIMWNTTLTILVARKFLF